MRNGASGRSHVWCASPARRPRRRSCALTWQRTTPAGSCPTDSSSSMRFRGHRPANSGSRSSANCTTDDRPRLHAERSMNRLPSLPQALLVSALLAFGVETVQGQATALPTGDVHAIYTRLLAEIQRIPIFDHHAHPGFGDDPDVDAEATPPEHLPLRERDSNPEFVVAVK